MTTSDAEQNPASYQMLFQQNQALWEELANLKAENQIAFALLVDTTRRLQSTSTSIKAAVSSLLNYDILWDASNQHEFLETINISTDLLSHLVTLLAFHFRVKAGELELKLETQSLQEIIAAVQVKLSKADFECPLEVTFTDGEKLVFVDYGYLIASLELLIEVISSQNDIKNIRIHVEDKSKYWLVNFINIDPVLVQAIRIKDHPQKEVIASLHLSSENILKLYTALDLLHMQNIRVDLVDRPQGESVLCLLVPATDS